MYSNTLTFLVMRIRRFHSSRRTQRTSEDGWQHQMRTKKNTLVDNPGPEQRIRSVSTRGGLRDFKDVVSNDTALTAFRETNQ